MTDIAISGLKELDAALQDLPAKIEKNVLRGAMRAGAKVMLDAARQQVPVKTGALRDSLTLKSGYQRGRVTGTVRAGNSKAYYAHMVELGTARHLLARPRRREWKREPAMGPHGTRRNHRACCC